MSVSVALLSSFLPFTQLHISHSRMGRTISFISLSFGSNHPFKIPCNYHDVFYSSQQIGPIISVSITISGTYVVIFSLSYTVSILLFFPMLSIVVEYGHQVCTIFLHFWNGYLLPLEMTWCVSHSKPVNSSGRR